MERLNGESSGTKGRERKEIAGGKKEVGEWRRVESRDESERKKES